MTRALAITAVLASASAALARPPDELTPPALTAPTPATPRATTWYGHEILLVDLGSLGLTVGGLVFSEGGIASVIGLAGLWLGAPILHMSHGNSGRAAFSLLALRPALSLVGFTVGANVDCDGEWCELGNAVIGATAGLVAASFLDAAVAFELQIAPIVQPHGQGYGQGYGQIYGLGVAGAF